jgi:tetratricopeptide (TPR) repeat protein
LQPQAKPEEHSPLRYREALALEARREFQRAAAIYRELAEEIKGRPQQSRMLVRLAACLGREEDTTPARQLLAKLHYEALNDEWFDLPLIEEIHVALGVMEAERYLVPALPAADDAQQFSIPPVLIPVKRWLSWLDERDEFSALEKQPLPVPPFPRESMQAIRDAIALAPNHPQTPQLQLALALIQAGQNQPRTSIQELTRLLVKYPHDRVAIHAVYNRGLLQLRDGDYSAAKVSFLEVVDRTQNREWKSLGWWWVGRTQMDAMKFKEAIMPLAEAISFGEKLTTGKLASMGLAAIYLAEGEPRKAYEILDPQRRELRDPLFRPYAAFLDCRARLSLARMTNRKSFGAETDDLLESILQFPPDSPVGPLLTWLVSDTASEMGLDTLARPRLETAGKDLRGPLAIRMTHRLGEIDLRLGQTKSARSNFAAAAVDSGEWGSKSRLALAEIALRDADPEAAIQQAFEVLQRTPDLRESALKLMGQAYVQLGDSTRAAVCFGGDVPRE